ncbi:MAG: type I DNA topoisomerase, partial [Chloroflexi bacterium]|nr:type I DNA topoisomerase [Chloroflexota bacterium]
LATDPDREGEAISWHLAQTIGAKGKPVHRVVFHEITKNAISDAFKKPREIDMRLVDAQQARRVLDRLVGYSLSPLLRQKMSKRNLSAGRVQSVALRLIVEREREIDAFEEEEYWTIDAELVKRPARGKNAQFPARLQTVRGEKPGLESEAEATGIVRQLDGATYRVSDIRLRELQRNPAPPFTTSTLQQEASRKLGFNASRTMRVAQQLYEGLTLGAEGSVGLITYMRTDSTNLAASAVEEVRGYIGQRFGPEYVPEAPRVYKARAKGAQEAHEAVRPTSVQRTPDSVKGYLTSEQNRLYRLIWQRFVACQMASARIDQTTVEIGAGPNGDAPFVFRATGSITRFPGFISVYTESHDDGEEPEEDKTSLPELAVGEVLDLVRLVSEQHFTQPPPRYTEASLVKALEEHGIGRPSTYAPTIGTIQDRGYVQRNGRQLVPTELGKVVTDLLIQHFPEVLDVGFTAEMEDRLDEIASGEREWVGLIRDFHTPFASTLKAAERDMEPIELKPELAGIDCAVCGRPMYVKHGRFGKFIACSGFPSCRETRPLLQTIGVACPNCGSDLVQRSTKKGRQFFGCSRYPECDFSSWQRPVPDRCPVCGGLQVLKDRRHIRCTSCGRVAEYDVSEAPVGAAIG